MFAVKPFSFLNAILALVLSFVIYNPTTRACICIPIPKLTRYELARNSAQNADVVFLGVPKVLHGDGKTEGTDDLVIFDVETVFKGEKSQQLAVHSGMGTTTASSCGIAFEIGKSYLVFASRFEQSLMTNECSFTALAADSDVALRFLRKQAPHPDDLLTPSEVRRNSNGRICGAVRRGDGQPLHDAAVYIWNDSDPTYEQEAWFARPDKDGWFESYFLSPGVYRITAVDRSYGDSRWVGSFPVRTDDPSTMGKVDVVAGRDFRSVDIVLHEEKVYSIEGTVRSSDGSRLAFEGVEIDAELAPDEKFPYLKYIRPRGDGTFTITRVPAGAVRLKTYVSKYADPDWEITVTDVRLAGDIDDLEIVLERKSKSSDDSLPSQQ
jgi:hypothetical protein